MFFLRAAALVLNDILDRDFDALVPRTRLRPMARGALSPLQGYLWLLLQVLCFLLVVRLLPEEKALRYSVPHLVLHALYPPAKRVTDFTPFVIGPAWAYGLLIGSLALGVDPFETLWQTSWAGIDKTTGNTHVALWCLTVAYACWGVVFESIYAHQDVASDEKAGVKSIALRYRDQTKYLVASVAALQIALMATAGILMQAGLLYYTGACGIAGGSLAWMTWSVDLNVPDACLSFFKNNCWYVGGGMAAGLIAEYAVRLFSVNDYAMLHRS